MSYLDVPRIQFGGLFFTNPATINNIIQNYNPKVPLKNAQGQYLPNAVWNPTGVARAWLAQCSVLSVVDASGTYSSAPGSDPVIGAPVETPSPSTQKQMPNSTSNYDFAKMVDLDPEQQGRSALFGLRIYVTLPNGAGCSGLVTVPELQYLLNRVPNPQSSWGAVGTWMGQMTDVTWSGDLSSSPFLTQFQAACGQGIAVKLTVDLHQNNPATANTQGNMFCYGRVLGSLGPIGTGELPQVVPGRQISPPPPSAGPMAAMAPAPQAAPRHPSGKRMINDRFGGSGGPAPAAAPAQMAAAAPAPPAQPWNPAPAQVSQVGTGSMLHVDLGGSIYLQGGYSQGIGVSNGQFLVDSGIDIGYLDSQGTFQPLQNGQGVSFANQYQQLNSQNKQVFLVQSSGLVDIPLEPAEATAINGSPLAVQAGGAVVLQEQASGYLMGTNPFSVRLEPDGTATFQLMARQFGQPIVGQQPVTWQISDDSGNPSTEIAIAWDGSTDANGLATLTVSTPGGDVTLPDVRRFLDTNIYFVFFLDPDNQLIGDAYADPPQPNSNLTALRFQTYVAPANPTWQNDVGPILQAYARLYPGMTGILDIGDEATVQQNAAAIAQRLSLLFLDPGLMPVTRDLSSAKVAMVVNWLNSQQGS
ncbi:MAG TPA: hypothetical protein VN493_31285 [Thermoanaerobaculia bacterium]|nr:hypothetical protein [Thermoanaerobaculia bacterium]